MLERHGLSLALGCAILAILFGIVSARWILRQPTGNERMITIATAIQEYFDEYVSRIVYSSPPGTMQHNLERMISVVQRNRKIRNYIKAIMALYFSSDVDRDIWTAMHSPAIHHNKQWIEALDATKQLQPWVQVDKLVDDLVRFEYATINDWAQGRIPDDEVIVRLVSSYLSWKKAGAL